MTYEERIKIKLALSERMKRIMKADQNRNRGYRIKFRNGF